MKTTFSEFVHVYVDTLHQDKMKSSLEPLHNYN